MSGAGRGAGRPPRRPTAPSLLDPILAAWERVDRRRRHIRPIRRDGVLGVEFRRHRGRPIRLRDGTTIEPGARIGAVHFDNRRATEFAVDGWLVEGWRAAVLDFQALAAWASARPPEERPVAYGATTILVPLARRAGFEVIPRRRTPWARLEDWHYRSLMRRWNPAGPARLRRGHGRLRSASVWLSDAELRRRYGRAGG